MDKKKLLALLIFLIMGFFMASYANPSEGLKPIKPNNTKEVQPENKENGEEEIISVNTNTKKTKKTNVKTKNNTTNDKKDDITTNEDNPEDEGFGNVEKDLYRVRFLDYSNNVLKSQNVYEGDSADASDITVSNYTLTNITYTFSKWDKDFSNITSNLDVKALYSVEKIIATVYINGEKTDNTVEIIVNNDTKEKKDVDLTDNNIDDYIKDKDELPDVPEGKNDDVDKLTYDEEEGYIIEINEEFIDYTVKAFNGAKVNGKTSLTAHINDEITLTYDSKNGYAFKNYTVSNDRVSQTVTESKITVGTSDLEVYANYEVIPYKITYTLNNGTVNGSNPTGYDVETDTFTLINPTLPGYDFDGWTGTGLTSKTKTVTIKKGSTGDREYTANFTARTDTAYAVNVYVEDIDSDDYILDTNLSYETTGQTDLEFTVTTPNIGDGFTLNTDKTKADIKVTVDGKAHADFYFNRDRHKVTYVYHDENNNIEVDVKHGGSLDDPAGDNGYNENNITYVFDGFDGSATNVVDDMTINALYKVDSIKAKVVINNIDVTDENNHATIKKEQRSLKAIDDNTNVDTLSLELIDELVYETDSDYNYIVDKLVYTKDAGFTVVITSVEKTYKVTALDNVTVDNKKEVKGTYNTKVELSHTTIDDKTFLYYVIDDGTTETQYTDNEYYIERKNVTVSAVYEREKYKINYTLNGGQVDGTNKTEYTSETDTFTLINPTKEGHKFAGWTGTGLTSKTKTVTITKGSKGNREYIANWDELKSDFTITTNVVGNKPCEYGDELEITVTIKNNGDDSGSVTLSDPSLMETLNSFEVVSSSITRKNTEENIDGNTLVTGYTIDNVATGETVVIKLKVKITGNAGGEITTGYEVDPEYGDTVTADEETIKIETTVKFVKKTETPVGTNIIILLDDSASMGWRFEDDTTSYIHTFTSWTSSNTYDKTCKWYGDYAYAGDLMIYDVEECKHTKLVNAKAAAQSFLEKIFTQTSNSNNSKVAAYKFGSRGTGYFRTNYSDVIGTVAENYNSMLSLKESIGDINSYPQYSGTPYYMAFNSAYEALYGRYGNGGLSTNNNKNVVIFLTDGAPDDKEDERNAAIAKLNSNGKSTVIYSIGYGISETDNEFALLKTISENSGDATHKGKAFATGIDDLMQVFNTIQSDIQDHTSNRQSVSGVAEMGSDVVSNKPIVINVTSVDGTTKTMTFDNLDAAMAKVEGYNDGYIIKVGNKYDVDAKKFNAGDSIEVVFYGENEEEITNSMLNSIRSTSRNVKIDESKVSKEITKGIDIDLLNDDNKEEIASDSKKEDNNE